MASKRKAELPPNLSRLPPGRHGLSREFVKENQQARLTAGTIAAVTENGYHAATISQIVAAAGLSRRTFYGYFKTKEACFSRVLSEIGAHLRAEADRAAEGIADPLERLAAELDALLKVFAENPDLAICCLRDAPIAGGRPEAAFRDALRRVASQLGEASGPGSSATERDGLVGGVAAIIRREVLGGRGAELPGLAPGLMRFSELVVPIARAG